jgi:hypothetical protein
MESAYSHQQDFNQAPLIGALVALGGNTEVN